MDNTSKRYVAFGDGLHVSMETVGGDGVDVGLEPLEFHGGRSGGKS